jgi:uncharacterized protein (DUF2252 family)
VAKIPTSPDARKTALNVQQLNKMSESAHAYVRGNTVRFYEWLKSDSVKASLPSGPDVWICGDCHTGNLGPVADSDGHIDIQIRDLDQTVIGNPAHDLLRLGLSLAMAARSSDLPGVTSALMLEEAVSGYLAGLTGHQRQFSRNEITPIARVMREAKTRRWKHLAEERIEDVRPQIPLGRRFWPLSKKERADVENLFEDKEVRTLVERIHGKGAGHLKVVDSAYWMKGCSSLGLLRYAVLVRTGRRDCSYHLLDVKQAVHAAAPCSSSTLMPSNDAERVIAGARSLSPFLGERMAAVKIGGRHAFVRELRPQDMKFELVGLSRAEAVNVARLLAGVVGKAHGRQMKPAERSRWSKELRVRHGKGLDAPRWLWSAVLELVALHESAYLEHCRRYALGQAN